MAVTAQQVFNMATTMIDEAGASATPYTSVALNVLTALQTELLPSTTTPVIITSMSDTLLLSDYLCLAVLPYGLAAQILITDNLENQGKAIFFNDRYEELKAKRKVEITSITDVYDVTSGMV